MKRNLGLALVAVIVIALTVLLPTSFAKRNDNSVKHSNSGGQILPELFRLNKQDENPAAPIAMRAVNFAESIPVRDFPAAEGKKREAKSANFSASRKGRPAEANSKWKKRKRRTAKSSGTPIRMRRARLIKRFQP